MINNRNHVYVPIKLNCGILVYCRPSVLSSCPSILTDLQTDLCGALSKLPKSVYGLVRKTKIWVNSSYEYGPINQPITVHHSTTHHEEGWLRW
mmetsp:Transcript_56659/g.68165  ORF Transcript_56659/g.68165 Transcript_56659/m.68165 type:complete len:93 (-) Transcript_56659:1291-1569(-)